MQALEDFFKMYKLPKGLRQQVRVYTKKHFHGLYYKKTGILQGLSTEIQNDVRQVMRKELLLKM
jgi:hypothetical protein